MFVRSQAVPVEAFAPSALPDFSANPASIPAPVALCRTPVTLPRHTHRLSDPTGKSFRCAWFVLDPVWLLDAVCDPGVGTGSRPRDPIPVACIRSQVLGLLHFLSGLPTGFSVLRFTSQLFLTLGFLLQLEYGMADWAFPGGPFTLWTEDPFQVSGYSTSPTLWADVIFITRGDFGKVVRHFYGETAEDGMRPNPRVGSPLEPLAFTRLSRSSVFCL